MIVVSDETYQERVLGSGYPVLLVFGRRGDLDSRVMGPELVAFEAKMDGRVLVAAVDIESCPEICRQWGVGFDAPVLIFLRYGVMERVLHGVRPAARIERDLAEYFGGEPEHFTLPPDVRP
ncbi:thioredoxin family protein [Stackebrandtia soli]|uniref:thioredoxin family protein n=1 Tax=Stackebrandtia soli TaxID=1892856 RepID=UPI0039E8D255